MPAAFLSLSHAMQTTKPQLCKQEMIFSGRHQNKGFDWNPLTLVSFPPMIEPRLGVASPFYKWCFIKANPFIGHLLKYKYRARPFFSHTHSRMNAWFYVYKRYTQRTHSRSLAGSEMCTAEGASCFWFWINVCVCERVSAVAYFKRILMTIVEAVISIFIIQHDAVCRGWPENSLL